jgi:hypothetical protein
MWTPRNPAHIVSATQRLPGRKQLADYLGKNRSSQCTCGTTDDVQLTGLKCSEEERSASSARIGFGEEYIVSLTERPDGLPFECAESGQSLTVRGRAGQYQSQPARRAARQTVRGMRRLTGVASDGGGCHHEPPRLSGSPLGPRGGT